MCCIRRVLLLAAFGTFLSTLWPQSTAAQQAPPIERFPDPALQNDTTLQLDGSSGRRGRIRDASPAFRPPITTLPQRPGQRGWQLGIHADKTDTGLLITGVVRGSAAERAGLRRGDRILTIGTERVGRVGNRTIPTRQVLRRQADFQGDVLLLVQPNRNRGLINVSIRLDVIGR